MLQFAGPLNMLSLGSNCTTRVFYVNGVGGTMSIKFLFFTIVSWDTLQGKRPILNHKMNNHNFIRIFAVVHRTRHGDLINAAAYEYLSI